MRRSKFSVEQILAIVKEGEAGRKVADLVRAHAKRRTMILSSEF